MWIVISFAFNPHLYLHSTNSTRRLYLMKSKFDLQNYLEGHTLSAVSLRDDDAFDWFSVLTNRLLQRCGKGSMGQK